MRDIATATLSGNLTRDVELKSLPSGTDVARLRVATTTRRRAGEEWVDKTNYFTVEVYGAQARNCAQYLRKGSRVFVDAELDWREWTDQQDNKREAVTFRARQVVFEGGRPTSAARPPTAARTERRGPGARRATRAASRWACGGGAETARRAPTICRSDPTATHQSAAERAGGAADLTAGGGLARRPTQPRGSRSEAIPPRPTDAPERRAARFIEPV